MSPEEQAVALYLYGPRPRFEPCGCLGPQGNQPKCPCAMQLVMQVDGQWYQINERWGEQGVEISAHPLEE